MSKNVWKKVLLSILLLVFPLSFYIKERVFSFERLNYVFAESGDDKEQEKLEEELADLEKQIREYESDITKTQQEKDTLLNQIYILRNRINKLNTQAAQTNLIIKDISVQIGDTQDSIGKVSLEIDVSKSQLASILRAVYEEDQYSEIEILLSGDTLSDFFDNLIALNSLSSKNCEVLGHIEDLKGTLVEQERALGDEREDREMMLKMQLLQKEESAQAKKQQEWLLQETKGKEWEYQKLLAETKARAQEIRQRIFELVGVSEAPTFGEAYDIAKQIESITGVRPALLLAVLSQESSIGKNVGQCYLKNKTTGEGIVISTGDKISRVMKPTRDVSPFLTTCKELGRDPYATRVSCPMSYGYGGAMGPAQFIPSTWVMYKDRVKAITGKPADPWDIKDAFLAAALYLSDYGAKSQTYNGEWRAAMIYFSGSTNVKYRFYGDSVMRIAAQLTKDIEDLEKGS